MPSFSHLLLLICSVLVVSPIPIISAADPDALQDFCVADTSSSAIFMNGLPCLNPNIVTVKHFTTSDLGTPGNTSNPLGLSVISTDASNMPGINTLGVSMLRGDVAVGGLVAPHTHPRASEMVFVVQGEFNVGFVDTSNKLFSTNIKAGDVFLFPKGTVHYLHNIGSTPALIIVAFNSQNPGISFLHQATFASNPTIPTDVLSKAFKITPQEVDKIKKGLAGN